MSTGQTPAALEWKNTPGKHVQSKSGTNVVHVYIIAEASRTSAKNVKVKSEVSVVMQQARTGAYGSRLVVETDYAACNPGKHTNARNQGE